MPDSCWHASHQQQKTNPARTQPSLQPRTHTAASSMLPTLASTAAVFLGTAWPSCCSTHTIHDHEHHSAYPVCNNHAPQPLLPAQVGVCPVRRPQSSTAGVHAAAITPTPCKNKFLSSQSPPVETKSTARSGRSSRKQAYRSCPTGVSPNKLGEHPVPQGVQQRICRLHSSHTLCG
jgi:hypothetical protein